MQHRTANAAKLETYRSGASGCGIRTVGLSTAKGVVCFDGILFMRPSYRITNGFCALLHGRVALRFVVLLDLQVDVAKAGDFGQAVGACPPLCHGLLLGTDRIAGLGHPAFAALTLAHCDDVKRGLSLHRQNRVSLTFCVRSKRWSAAPCIAATERPQQMPPTATG